MWRLPTTAEHACREWEAAGRTEAAILVWLSEIVTSIGRLVPPVELASSFIAQHVVDTAYEGQWKRRSWLLGLHLRSGWELTCNG
jgi:hypothetical protein